MLSRFWLLREWGEGWGLSESIRKGKFMTKIFFSNNIEWSFKNLWKMMSADVKANIKQQEIKDPVVYPTKKYLQNLKYNIKRGCIFHLILVGIPFVLILSIKNRGAGRVFIMLNGQNPLSITKIICRQFLISTMADKSMKHLIDDPNSLRERLPPSMKTWTKNSTS